ICASATSSAPPTSNNPTPSTVIQKTPPPIIRRPRSAAAPPRVAGNATSRHASDRATMETHYTHTTWHVKPGSEEEFVRRWGEWADWTRRQGLVEDALLLQDTEDPRRFVSFGPWESVARDRRLARAPR